MSQEKVDRYKEQKANRKEIMKKEKRMRVLRNTVASLVFAAVVGWVGYSGYQAFADRPMENAEVDYTSIAEYITGLSQTE